MTHDSGAAGLRVTGKREDPREDKNWVIGRRPVAEQETGWVGGGGGPARLGIPGRPTGVGSGGASLRRRAPAVGPARHGCGVGPMLPIGTPRSAQIRS